MAEADESRFSYQVLMGFTVVDSIQGELGIISNFFQKTGQDLLMMDYKEAEILIPVTDEVVTSVDITTKQIFTTLPDGLIEIYLNEDVSESDEN
mgnify:FL=1